MSPASSAQSTSATSGCEWLIEALGCDEAALRDVNRLEVVFEKIVAALGLHPVASPAWHRFPGEGGVTGVCMLSESHLTCHTFPEYRSMCLNVFCCRPRPGWDFEACLRAELGAASVRVRRIDRAYQ